MIIKNARTLDLLNEYYFSQKLQEIAGLKAQGMEVINLGIGNPDLSPPAEAIATLKAVSENAGTHGYRSYRGEPEFLKAAADWYERYFKVKLNPGNQIVPLNGSKEGITVLSMAFLNPGDAVLVPNPGYPAYKAAAAMCGAKSIEYYLTEAGNWLPNLNELEQLNLKKVKIMWINYPHMPTGASISKEKLRELVEFTQKHKILLVNDNPYSFILNTNYVSIFSVEGAAKNCIELNSLSKSHNLAGWRIGMLIASPEYIAVVLKVKTNIHSGMHMPMLLAAAKALQVDNSWYVLQNKIYEERKAKALELVKLLGCKASEKSSGMFVWAKMSENQTDSIAFTDKILYESGVFITPGVIFGSNGEGYIRIALASEVSVLQQAIEQIKTVQNEQLKIRKIA